MSNNSVSAVTVVYFSDLPMLKDLVVSLRQAATELFGRRGCAVHYYLIDNSIDIDYFSRLEALCAEFVSSDVFQLSLIKSPGNLGYGGGNNLVLDRLDSAYHLIINPDVVVQAEALWRATEYLEQYKDVAMLSPMVVDEGGDNHHVAKVYPDCFTLMLRYLGHEGLNRRFTGRLGRYQCDHLANQADKTVELAGGCFLFLHTELFQRLQGFDDRFFMYFEDYDLSIRARGFGAIAYVPSVKIAHAGGDVGRKKLRHHLFFCTSALKFFNRHGWRFW